MHMIEFVAMCIGISGGWHLSLECTLELMTTITMSFWPDGVVRSGPSVPGPHLASIQDMSYKGLICSYVPPPSFYPPIFLQ